MVTEHAHEGKAFDRVRVVSRREGWEVRVERDGRMINARKYRDWHRVERALLQLNLPIESIALEAGR
jgi:hypothetical protein